MVTRTHERPCEVERVLVTGGSGYFGGCMVNALKRAGHTVRVFDVIDSTDRPEDVEFVQGDIRDGDAVMAACRDVQVVHHNVAQVPLAKDPDAFWTVNRDGAQALFSACHQLGVRKVVNMSSSAVFGVPRQNPVTEDTAPSPCEDYGRAKLAAEEIAQEFRSKGLDITTIRPRTILGGGRLGIMQILFEWTRKGRNLPVLGAGENLYQLVHAEDLASACMLAARKPGGAIYNIGAKKFGTMRDTLEALAKHAGTGSQVVSVPEWPAVVGMRVGSHLRASPLAPYHWLMYGKSLYFDVSRAEQALGWTAKFSNAEMISESYDWYLEHRDSVLSQQTRSHHRGAVKHGALELVSRALGLVPRAGD